MKKSVMYGALVLLVALKVSLAMATENQTIVIGLAAPMTGSKAVFGEEMKQAAEIAVKKMNDAGGIAGKRIELEIEDDADQPQQAVAVANRFASRGVRFVVGHFSSGTTLPASDIYASNNIIAITPEAILSDITTKGYHLMFRTIGTDKQLAFKIKDYLEEKYSRQSKILMITDQSAPGAVSTSKNVESGLKEDGYKNVIDEYYMAGVRDFSALATKVKTMNPDVIYCSCFPVEAGLIIRATRNSGLKQPFVGWDIFNSSELWGIAGAAGEGTVFASDAAYDQLPSARDFVTELKAKNTPFETTSFTTYAAFQILQQAMEKASSLAPEDVAKIMHKDGFRTVVGDIHYLDNGDLSEPKYQLYIRRNAQTTPLN